MVNSSSKSGHPARRTRAMEVCLWVLLAMGAAWWAASCSHAQSPKASPVSDLVPGTPNTPQSGDQPPHTWGEALSNTIPGLSSLWRMPLTLGDLNLPYHTEESSGPTVTGDGRFLYGGTSDGRIHMVDAGKGEAVWSLDLKGGPILAPMTLINKERTLVAATIEGHVVALDRSGGEELWRYQGESGFMTAPVYSLVPALDPGKGGGGTGMVFVLDEGGVLTALGSHDGKKLWQYRRALPEGFRLLGSPAPVVFSHTLLAGFPDGALVSIAINTGEELWVSTGAGARPGGGSQGQFSGGPGVKGTLTDISTTPLLSPDQEVVYVAAFDQGVRAVSARDGSTLWRSKPTTGITGLALLPTGAGAWSLVATTSRGELLQFDSGDGTLLAENRVVDGGINGLMLQTANFALVWGPEIGLTQVNIHTGQTINTINPGTGVQASPAVSPSMDRVYILSNGGIIYAFQIVPRPMA